MAKDTKHLALGAAKLESSGLTTQDAKLLGIQILAKSETSALHNSFKALASLKINYYNLEGKPLQDWPKAPPFYRLRYLEQSAEFDSSKKPIRYTQEPLTAPAAYYPKNQKDWPEICKDTDVPLIVTEGELKAAKACKEGFPTIGLGGVYNWRSRKVGIDWIESLNYVTWVKRNVYICFDSDYRTNPMVCMALKELADALHNRGAFCHVVSLPQLAGLDKVGLDDYLVHSAPSPANALRGLLQSAEPLGLTKPLWELNNKYVYVQNPGMVIDQESKYKVSPSSFKEHLQAPLAYQERKLEANGEISFKSVSAAAAWLRWPLRMEATKLSYSPGAERFVPNCKGLMFNTWNGWGVEPKKGDVKLFLTLIDHLFEGAEEGAKQWFLQWCAYPLQFPGTKLFTSAVFHGIRHGTGKSLIGYSLGRIYGENFTEIAQDNLHSNFNEWAESKQFVLADDITGSNKRQDADLLKKMITQRELRINPKFISSYVIQDCINYFFTANHPDSFFLEDDDRRFFIHEVIAAPMDEMFYKEYDKWLATGGAAALFYYLLHVDVKEFNPAAPAFKTAAKERMIANVQSDLGAWCRALVANPDFILRVGDIPLTKDLYTNKELLNLYDFIGKTGTTANGLGRELSRVGVKQVNGGRPVKLADGSQSRLYAIRNADMWLGAQPKAIVEHMKEPVIETKTKKY